MGVDSYCKLSHFLFQQSGYGVSNLYSLCTSVLECAILPYSHGKYTLYWSENVGLMLDNFMLEVNCSDVSMTVAAVAICQCLSRLSL